MFGKSIEHLNQEFYKIFSNAILDSYNKHSLWIDSWSEDVKELKEIAKRFK